MATKETSGYVSSIAGRLLAEGKPDWMPYGYWHDLISVLGSALSQREKRHQDDEAVAVLTVDKVADMTPAGRLMIADWLRKQADNIVKDGDNYDDDFRARYLKA